MRSYISKNSKGINGTLQKELGGRGYAIYNRNHFTDIIFGDEIKIIIQRRLT